MIKYNNIVISIIAFSVIIFILTLFMLNNNYYSVDSAILFLNTTLFGILFAFNYVRTKNLLDYINIYGVYFYLYTNSIYINNIFFQKENYLYLDSMHYLAIASLITYVFFSLGYNFYYNQINTQNNSNEIGFEYNNSYTLLLWSIFTIGLLMEINVISTVGFIDFFSASRASRLLIIQHSGLLALYTDVSAFVSIVSFYMIIKYNPKRAGLTSLFVVSFIHNVIYAVFTVSRGDFLFQIIPMLYVLLDYKKIKKTTVIYVSLSLLVLFAFWKQIIPLIILNKSNQISFPGLPSEFSIWYFIGEDVLSTMSHNLLYGKSYLDSIIGLILPLYDFESLSVWYIKNYYGGIFSLGGGRGFSTIIESILNFGWCGVIITALLYGLIFARLASNKNKNDFSYLIYIFSLSYAYKLFRSEIFAVFKVYLWVYVFLAFITFVLAQKVIGKLQVK
ncbi:hypothetical protein Dtox_4098 [Desulfofarcimen acetoxidans DSM 771]|uniref:Oligosaccharide repeat unit polymerase n=1 Tax=Desulfofarcimen acetoxidans (strain ATCC 49208 / DSM 771 / KCTC 5769 / VKM B-1644 / 5575) TaxID=485916 RepID=C8VYP9_DESAS|nr:O-antigen polymerase [Desulfofarcimen acetoxidans]ACV64770.1 hypothetical protein Dtox_4098 [Desulfofarcimen acetoxidans DSM 771]